MDSGTAAAPLSVEGIRVQIDGTGPATLLMIHGWPDTSSVWDSTVAGLKDHYRCVRFTLPGFDLALPARPTSLEGILRVIEAIADAVSPGVPVTLVLHDWGCVFGYEFAARRPERVARIVGIDIGDHNSQAFRAALPARAKLFVLSYQWWLASAWLIGGPAGDRMTRWMARVAGSRAAPVSIGWPMNYPYAMSRFGSFGGLRGTAAVAPACPLLFIYAERKPFMFHSRAWIEALTARPGCRVAAFASGHWVMNEQAEAFQQCLREWLTATGGDA